MAYIDDTVLDGALDEIRNNTENLYICSAEPASYTEAQSTYKLGTKTSPTIGAPQNGDTSGRKITISAISDGTVDSSGTASHWALTDNSATTLLAAGSLASSQAVTASNTFTLTAFDIEFPDPS